MTDGQKNICHGIIHSHAAACGAGNVVPVPGLGVTVDLITMTTMTMLLAGVFGGSITEAVAEGIAITAIKRTTLKHPMKMMAKELSKIVPGLGQIVAPAISIAMIEAAGWSVAHQLERECA